MIACIGCELWGVLAAASGSGLVLFLKVYGKRIRHFFGARTNRCGCKDCGGEVDRGGSAPGDYHGRFSPMLSTLEGIENSNEPHRIGAQIRAMDITCYSTSAQEVWRPEAGKKLVVTDIHFTVTGNTSVVYVSEGSISNGLFIFKGNFKPPNGESVYIPASFSLPHVFHGTSSLFITQTDGAQIEGVVHGYETEV